jgi:hypothetical protein
MLTLTLKTSDAPLHETLTRLTASWRRFRVNRKIAPLLEGGLAFLELTLGKGTGQWHPHLHVLVEGAFLPIDLVRNVWHKVTGDSYIVHICALRSPADAASYVTKYAGKSLSPRVWHDPAKLQEAIEALTGRRTFNIFGNWQGYGLTQPPADDCEWEAVEPLQKTIARARAGDREAASILRTLQRGDPYAFCDTPPPDY